MDIEALKTEVIRIRQILRTAEEAVKNAEMARIKEAYGIEIGSIVMVDGKEMKVTKIDERWRRPWVSGHLKRKDGQFSIAVRNAYEKWVPK